jgi:hypothetical protein
MEWAGSNGGGIDGGDGDLGQIHVAANPESDSPPCASEKNYGQQCYGGVSTNVLSSVEVVHLSLLATYVIGVMPGKYYRHWGCA